MFFLVKRRDDFTFTLPFTVVCMRSSGNSCLCVFVSRLGGRYVNSDRIRSTHNFRRHFEIPRPFAVPEFIIRETLDSSCHRVLRSL